MSTLLPGNIVYGGEMPSRESSNYRSLGHFILEKFKDFGDRMLLINGATGEEYSAHQLRRSILAMVNVLRQVLNVKPHEVIGLCSENRIEFSITMYAAFALNAIVAPLNTTYTEREMQHAISISKPKVLFGSRQTVECLEKVAQKLPFVQKIVVFDDEKESAISHRTSHRGVAIYNFKQLLTKELQKPQNEFVCEAANKIEDVALIVCSSGTTGLPKGVQLTQNNVLTILDSQIIPAGIPLDEIRLLTVIPWFHSFGCLSLIIANSMGSCLVFLSKFEEHTFLGAIEKYRVMMAFMVPPLMVFLAKHPIVDQYDLSSLILLVCGAAPLSKETEDQIKERIGVPLIRQGYGLSETTLSVLVQNDDACKPGSVGSLKAGLYAKVIDTETGKPLGPNQRGELCFKGDCIMKGYLGDVKATQTAILDGWLHTGDVGYYDNDYEFFIVDRIKELIKYKGFQVPPAEIESLLLTHPKIKDAAVIGKPDELAGELPLAFVVTQDNVNLSAEEVINYVAERTSPAKRLRGGVKFVKEIAKNPSGKILRRVLRDSLQKDNIKSKL